MRAGKHLPAMNYRRPSGDSIVCRKRFSTEPLEGLGWFSCNARRNGGGTVSYDDLLMATYELRERMVADRLRPRYHFLPPEGRWNDVNGVTFWNGRYHIGYLQKIRNGPDQRDFSSWQHVSSRDLVHWRFHRASLREPLEGTKGDYFNSGDVMEGTEIPTIITNMPGRGICIYRCHDEDLDRWLPLAENPVIPLHDVENMSNTDYPESVIFDPSGWKEGDTYYALVGNRNFRPGYEGDSTSLFRSADLRAWEYVGPFYRSDRRWTEEMEDCACSDFFAFGARHMLLMHTHRPFGKCQYYIGSYENESFHPEMNGQLSRLGSMLSGPETLLDDRGRRIFWGWIGEARDWQQIGWSGVMTLPWHFTPAADNGLRIDPVEELASLRYGERRVGTVTVAAGTEVVLDELSSDCMEARMTIRPAGAGEFGLRLLCSPDGEEQTTVGYSVERQEFVIDFERASLDRTLTYPRRIDAETGEMKQIVPCRLGDRGELRLDIFVDRSVIEIFVNSEVVLVQRVYPTRSDSTQFRLFATGGAMRVENIVKWEMEATNPW